MSQGYQRVDGDEADQVHDALEALVTEGARKMLESALEEEVSAFLGRDRYQHSEEFRGYRNGYHRSREITVGLNPVQVKVPRVSHVPTEVSSDKFTSQIVRRYERVSKKTQELFRKLYVEGLATGDFEPVFRELVGETTALSANTIVRLKARWGEDYQVWCARSLEDHRYAYIWCDGVYLGAVNRTLRPASTKRWPIAHSAWVFPVPGNPKARTFTLRSMKSPPTRSSSCCLSFMGSLSCSRVSQVLPAGSLEARQSRMIRRCLRSSASCSRTSSRVCRASGWPDLVNQGTASAPTVGSLNSKHS